MRKSNSCFLFFFLFLCFFFLLLEMVLCLFWLFSLGVVKRRLLAFFLYGEDSLFLFDFSIFILCRAGLLESYCVNVFLSWNILFSPSMVIESFSGYSSLG